jgi:predicted transcriptional regulator
MLFNYNTKSKSFKELEKKFDREIKQVSEDLIKEKLDTKN